MMLVYVWVDGKGEATRRRLVMKMMLRGETRKLMGVVREMYRAERSVHLYLGRRHLQNPR